MSGRVGGEGVGAVRCGAVWSKEARGEAILLSARFGFGTVWCCVFFTWLSLVWIVVLIWNCLV